MMKGRKMLEYMKVVEENIKTIEYEARDLISLSDAFYITGNQVMGEELRRIAARLRVSCTDIRDEAGSATGRFIQAADERSKTMLKATLAGIALVTEGED